MSGIERLENTLYQIERKMDKINEKEETEYNKGYFEGLNKARSIVRNWRYKDLDGNEERD